jgi:drug/metabolite transporter (DMT)-like permease
MLWFILSLSTALSESIRDVFSKKSLQHADVFVTSWAWRFFSLPFLLPLLLVVEIPAVGPDFWWALGADGMLNVIASLLYLRAIQQSDLSITIPIITFTPIFLLLTSPLIVGEFPSPVGILGIVLIVAGSYVLNLSKRTGGYLAPIKALFAEPGPRLMLVVALIFSVTANLDKVGVENSSPIIWSVAMSAFIAAVMVPVVAIGSRTPSAQLRAGIRTLVLIGLFNALVMVLQMSALELTLVAYVISIKRTSAIMSVVWGHLLFKEPGLKERAAGAVLMVLGVVCISVFG